MVADMIRKGVSMFHFLHYPSPQPLEIDTQGLLDLLLVEGETQGSLWPRSVLPVSVCHGAIRNGVHFGRHAYNLIQRRSNYVKEEEDQAPEIYLHAGG